MFTRKNIIMQLIKKKLRILNYNTQKNKKIRVLYKLKLQFKKLNINND